MEKGAPTTMIGVTGHPHPRSTRPPQAGPANVLASRVGEEDICTTPPTLHAPDEPTAKGREGGEIHGILNPHEDISVLRCDFVGGQGTDQGNLLNSTQTHRTTDKEVDPF